MFKRKAASPSAPAMAPLAALPRTGAAQGAKEGSSPVAGGDSRAHKSSKIDIVSYVDSDSDFI